MFFLVLNFAIHFFYKNYIKRDFYNKIKKMKRFLEVGEKEKINYLKEKNGLRILGYFKRVAGKKSKKY